MPNRIRRTRPHRKPSVGDLDQEITLQNRKLMEPVFGQTSFGEDFSAKSVVFAGIKTVVGRTVFTGVDTGDVPVSHEVTIRFDECVTDQTWILTDAGLRLDILLVEDWEERHEYQFLTCRATGDKDTAAARV